jgi:hypothetical protein
MQVVEEDRKERVRLSESLMENENISVRSFSVHSVHPRSPLHSIARRYLVQRSFEQLKTLKSCRTVLQILTSPLPVFQEILMIEESIPLISLNCKDQWFWPALMENGEFYEGQWDLDSGKFHGFGVLLMKDQSKYTGQFFQGRKTGKGRLISLGGEVVDGEFKNDLPEGQAVLTKSNGLVYKGEFKKGKEH